MTALRYGSCSVSLIDSVAVTSGSAALSSALSFERTLGVERRWTVMIWEQSQSLRHEKGPPLMRRTLRIHDVVSVPAIEKF